MSPTAVDGGGTRAFGAWSYVGWRRKLRAVVLIGQVLIQPGVDDGGKRSGVTSVGLRGRNVRLGNEEEEALRRKGEGDDDDGFRGKGGKRGRWTWREEGEEVC
jgi:hypothetical protein